MDLKNVEMKKTQTSQSFSSASNNDINNKNGNKEIKKTNAKISNPAHYVPTRSQLEELFNAYM